MEDQNDALPVPAAQRPDPDAPVKATLPSGKVVEIRSHRTLLGADIARAIAAQTGVGMQSVVDMHNELIAILATEIEPGKGDAPPLNGTLEAVLAQRGDDYRRLYALAVDAWQLATGLSVIPDQDEWADPTGPTRGTSDSRPPSEESAPS